MEQIGYLIAGLVILGFLAVIIWELFVSGVKLILFAIGLAIVVAIYEYIQANMKSFKVFGDTQSISSCFFRLYFLHTYGNGQEKENG